MSKYDGKDIFEISQEDDETKKTTKHRYCDEYCVRRKTVMEIAIHHTTGPFFQDADAEYIQQAFSDAGYARGYRRIPVGYPQQGGTQRFTEYNYADGYCETFNRYVAHVQPISGEVSFAMYNFIMHRYEGHWRLVPMFLDPLGNKSGGLWQFTDDLRTISVAFCGNYLKNQIDPEAVNYLVKMFKALREVRGTLIFRPHKSYDSTQCPGRIAEEIDRMNQSIKEA